VTNRRDVPARTDDGGLRLFLTHPGPALVLALLAGLPTLAAMVVYVVGVLTNTTLGRHGVVALALSVIGWSLPAGLIAPGAVRARDAPMTWRDWFVAARGGATRALGACVFVSVVLLAAARIDVLVAVAVFPVIALVPAVAAVERRSALATLRRGVGLAASHAVSLVLTVVGFVLVSAACGAALGFGSRALFRMTGGSAFEVLYALTLALGFALLIAGQALLGCLIAAGYVAWRGPLPGHDVARVFD
jgi:hypothetical protein